MAGEETWGAELLETLVALMLSVSQIGHQLALILAFSIDNHVPTAHRGVKQVITKLCWGPKKQRRTQRFDDIKGPHL